MFKITAHGTNRRSGIASPTGTIHPRKDGGQMSVDRSQPTTARVAAPEGVKESPPPVAPPCRHSGIFIPPAQDSGIADLRWRNENVRNLLRHGPGDSGHFHPARLHSLQIFNIVAARDENSGMTTEGAVGFRLFRDSSGEPLAVVEIGSNLVSTLCCNALRADGAGIAFHRVCGKSPCPAACCRRRVSC